MMFIKRQIANNKIDYKKIIIYIIIFIILVLLITHLNKFLKTNNNYEILQINNKISAYDKYLKENLPLVILNHRVDDIKTIVSPLTIKKKYISNYEISNKYMSHTKDTFFIIPDEEIRVNISAPNEINSFKKSSEYSTHIKLLELNDKNKDAKFIQIILKPGNILSIPRYWIFNIESNVKSIGIFFSDTIFSFLFSVYQIFPYIYYKIMNKLFKNN